MFTAIDSPYLVPFDGSFSTKDVSTSVEQKLLDDKKNKDKLNKHTDKIHDLQRIMYAHDSHAMLLIFQAMDAAGKDSTIRNVLTGVNGGQPHFATNLHRYREVPPISDSVQPSLRQRIEALVETVKYRRNP